MHIAYCDASGVVGFAAARGKKPAAPAGTIVFASGDKATIEALRATLRLAHDGKTFLVPGVPEATDQKAGIAALNKYCDWLRQRRIISPFKQ